MMKSSLNKQIEITRRGAVESYRVKPAGVSGPKQPSVDPEITRLIAASKAALAEVDRATASGSPSSISAAKSELRTIMAKLESARADGVMKVAMTEALRTPQVMR
jgi:hypothetical protein